MKCLPFVVVLLLVGLIVGCAPTVSQANREVTRSGNGLDPELTLTGPNNTSTPTPLVTLAPTNTPMAVPTVTPTPITTHTPTNTPVALSTALSAPTATHTPTNTPATVPTVAVAPVSSIDSATSEALVEYGLQVYEQQYCGVCHQLDAANTSGLFGPSQNGLGRTAEERIRTPGYTGQARTAAEYIRESILDPAAYYVEGYEQSRHHMPAFTHLSEAELNALVQMLLQQK